VTCVAGSDRQFKFSEHSDWGPKVAIIAPSEFIESSCNTGDDQVNTRSGTSYAAPIVAGIMSIFVSFEHLWGDVGQVRDRLMRNSLVNVVTNVPGGTTNRFVQSGIHNTHKSDQVPYDGAPAQEQAIGNDPKPGGGGPIQHVTVARQYCLLKFLGWNLIR
jgi:subtilisin family serine protease